MRRAIYTVLVLTACGQGEPQRAASNMGDLIEAGGADIEIGPLATPQTQRFYDGYFAEAIRGDLRSAREAYRTALYNAGQAPTVAAKAALHLAEIESLAGRPRDAVELLSRAAALAPDDRELAERAASLRFRLTASSDSRSEVRGPPQGTAVRGVKPEVARAFANAELALARYHKRPRLRIEDFRRAGLRQRNRILLQAVEAYEVVIAMGDPSAKAAAQFRIGSLYHDSSVSLLFELPADLNPRAKARERRALQPTVLDQLKKAREAYRRAAEGSSPGAKEWQAAARLALASVEELLRGSK